MEKTKKLYRYINGSDLNDYEKTNKRLSYYNLFYKDENRLLCNNIIEDYENNEIIYGEDYNEEEGYYIDFYQYFLIDESTAERLGKIGEVIYYNNRLDIYFLAVSHFGTAWDYVLTDIRLEKQKDGDYYEAYYYENE